MEQWVCDPSGDVCSPWAKRQQLREPGGPRCEAPFPSLNTHLFSKKRNSVSLKRWRASALGAAMLAVPCPCPGDPRVAALESLSVPAVVPGPGRLSRGAAGPGGTCRQMSVSPLCQQPGGSLPAPEVLQGGPCTFSEAELSLVAVQ